MALNKGRVIMLEAHNIEVLCSQTFAIILKCLNHMQKRPHCHMCCAGIFNKVFILFIESMFTFMCWQYDDDYWKSTTESDLIRDLNLL